MIARMLDGRERIQMEYPLYKYLEYMAERDREEFTRAVVADPLTWFCPNGRQEEFIRLVANSVKISKIPTVLFTAANGVGKTTVSLHILSNIIYGAQNGWFNYPLYMNYPFPKLAWYVTTRSAIENVIVRLMKELFPPGTYTLDKRGKPYVSAVHFTNGWELVFFTQDQDTKEMESATVGLIIGDEPFTEDIWKVLKSRRRGGCVTILPMTPLDVEPFIIDEVDKFATAKKPGYYRLSASVYDACKKRGVRGHLDPEVIDAMVDGYSEDEKQARVHGDFMYFSERVYATLDPERHWVAPEDYPLVTGLQRVKIGVDPADGRPCAVAWMQLQPIKHSDEYVKLIREGRAKQQWRKVIFMEWPEQQTEPFWDLRIKQTLPEQQEQWFQMEENGILAEYGLSVTDRILDKYFGWQTRNSATVANSLAEAARKIGRYAAYRKSYISQGEESELTYGHNLVREALADLEDGKPGLVIWRNCWHTWNGLTHYVRKRARNSDTDRAVGETKLVEKYKDFPDVVRYLVCDRVTVNTKTTKSASVKSSDTSGTRDPIKAILSQM